MLCCVMLCCVVVLCCVALRCVALRCTQTYFHIHHTEADTVDKVDPVDYAQNIAVMTIWAYVMAELPFKLPHTPTNAAFKRG